MKQDELYEEMIEGTKNLTHGLVNVVEDLVHKEAHRQKKQLSKRDILILIKEKKDEYDREFEKFLPSLRTLYYKRVEPKKLNPFRNVTYEK